MKSFIPLIASVIFLVSLMVAGCGGDDPTPPGPGPGPSPSEREVQIGTAALPETTYAWLPSESLDNPTAAMPKASPKKTTLYTVTAKTKCGSATSTVSVRVFRKNLSGELVEIL